MRTELRSKVTLLFLTCAALMLIFPAMAFAQGAPTIQSDKADYAPGELVTLSGSGWQAGESVNIFVNDDEGQTWSRNVGVAADANGNISDSFNLPDWFVATYSVTATGASGTATTSFTDANLRFLSSGPTLSNVSWQKYSNNTCTTAITTGTGNSGSGNINTNDSTGQPNSTLNVTAVNNQFVGLTAPATAGGQVFSSWSGTSGNPTFTTSNGGRTVCVAGDNSSGLRRLTANYVANTAPTISDIADQTTNEDVAKGPISFTIGDAHTAAADLQLSGSSSNTTLVPNSNISFGGSGANRTVTVTPAANQFGTATITVQVSDGSLNASDTFVLTVTSVNDDPTISNIADQTTNEDVAKGPISFTVGDVETAAANLQLSGSSSNQTLVPNANISFGGSGANRTVTVTPAADKFGTATITVTVTDADGGTNSDTFVLTVIAVNDDPVISSVSGGPVNEGSPATITVNATDVDNAASELRYKFDCDNDGTFEKGPHAANTDTCTFNDNGSYRVNVEVTDGVGGSATSFTNVQVNNVAPTVTFTAGSQDVNEDKNGSVQYSFSVSDPGDDPFAPKSGFPDCGTGGTLVGSLATTASGGSFNCRFSDGPATPTVRMQVVDADEPANSTTADSNIAERSVIVRNVAPTVNLSGLSPVNEGTTHTYSFSVNDPGADTHSVTSYSCDPPNGTLVPGTNNYNDTTKTGSLDCNFPNGPATANVTVRVADDDGAADADNQPVTVNVLNVAPVVDLTGSATADEGQTKTYTYTIDDVAADLANMQVTEDCGTGSTKINTPTANSFDCTFPDGPADPVVKVTATDPDGDSGSDEVPVHVSNLPPTIGSVTNNGPINEGQSATISINNASDPAGANDPLAYYFDCNDDGTYEVGPQPGNTKSCSFNDDGTYDVNVKVSDGDGGEATGSTTVIVNNVAPTINSLTSSSDNVLTGGVNKVKFNANASAGPFDTITYTWSGGDPGTANGNTYTAGFSSCGEKTVTVTATDDDNSQAQMTKTVNAWNAFFQPPIKDGTVNTTSKGQVVPVKVNIGCGTTNLTTLRPVIQLVNGDATPEADSGTTAVTASVSSADTGQFMRPVDAGYIYNLQTPAAAAGTKYTIRVNPWGAPPAGATQQQIADWNLATGMYALLQIRK